MVESSNTLPGLPDTSTPAVAAWMALLRTHAAATRSLNARLSAEHGLTVNDYEVLLALAAAGRSGVRRTDLARSVQLTASGITRLLEGLERQELVCRRECEDDHRVSYAVLTDAGRERLAAASCTQVAGIEELFGDRFSDEDLSSLAELLGRLPGAPLACETEPQG